MSAFKCSNKSVLTLSLVLFLLFTLSSSLAYSQSGYTKGRGYVRGFVITSAGDSIPGFIELPSWGGKFNFFNFKTSNNSEKKSYDAYQISSLGTSNGRFVFKSIEIPTFKSSELSFVQQLVMGPYNLYGYHFMNFDHVVIEGMNRKFYDLTNPPNPSLNNDSRPITISREKFKSDLSIVFSEDPEIALAMGSIEPSRRKIVKSLTEYYNQKGTNYEVYGIREIKFYYGVFGATTFENSTFLFVDTKIKSDFSAVPGLGLILGVANKRSGLGLFLEGEIGHRSTHYSYKEIVPSMEFYFEGFQKDLISNTRLGISYAPPGRSRFIPVIEGGGIFSISLNNQTHNYYDVKIISENTAFSSSDNALAISEKYYGGFIRGGIQMKNSKNNSIKFSVGYDLLYDLNGERTSGIRTMFAYQFKNSK